MNVTEPMREQLAMLENFVEGFISDNMPPIAAKFIMNNPMYNEYMSKVTDTLIMFMDEETGMVDGTQAHEAIKGMFPTLSNWVSIPQKSFYIADAVNDVSNDIIGRSVL